jgi:RimJ/RimL family protein N-acetyltransferase
MILLTRGTPDDIAFVMSAERRPGYEPLVGRWTDAQHREALSAPDCVYLLGARDGEDRQGFAILRELDHPHGNIYLKRIAVLEAGRGFGQGFLHAVMAWVFAQPQAHRFWLEVVGENARARHVYAKLGFVEEGREREAYMRPDGSRDSYLMFSILRPEWDARREGGAHAS